MLCYVMYSALAVRNYFTFKGKLFIKNHSIETPGMIFSSPFFQAANDKKNFRQW